MPTDLNSICELIEKESSKIINSPITADDNFLAEGLDSLGALELAVQLEEQLGLSCNFEDVLEAPTPRELASRLHERS